MKNNLLILSLITTCFLGTGSVFGAYSKLPNIQQDTTQIGDCQRATENNETRHNTLFHVSGESTAELPTPISMEKASPNKTKYPLFAIKTNLLFDVASALNIEFEVPFCKQWSVAGEWIFPWWLSKSKQHCLQLLSGNIEGRYWLRESKARDQQLTGWFAGIYAGGGLYDIEWNRKGYQGEFYIAAGLSAGYAHNISRRGNLRMEYSLGVGYLKTNYHSYESRTSDNELVWNSDGNYTWVGPTRAKVSLVWMIDWGKLLNKKGGSR